MDCCCRTICRGSTSEVIGIQVISKFIGIRQPCSIECHRISASYCLTASGHYIVKIKTCPSSLLRFLNTFFKCYCFSCLGLIFTGIESNKVCIPLGRIFPFHGNCIGSHLRIVIRDVAVTTSSTEVVINVIRISGPNCIESNLSSIHGSKILVIRIQSICRTTTIRSGIPAT